MADRAIIFPAGFKAPITLQHLVMQLAVSGHLCLASQHLQSLLSDEPELPIDFMQSDMSMAASAANIVACGSIGAAAAHAEATGASVSDRAIKIANNARRTFSVRIPPSVTLS